MRLSPKEAMLLAIEEGKKGAGFVSPNPLVGCVILDKNSELIGAGYHARIGGDHAEISALKAVKDTAALSEAQVFVTLEPCAHEGRTPSCAKALAKLPIHSVTYGLEDPNPLVAGKGAAILREAGKSVTAYTGLQDEFEDLAEIYLLNKRQKRAFAAVKVAASLDGKIAAAADGRRPIGGGHDRWITGEESRAYVQFLRGCYDAVLIGAGTFLKDSPRLNARHPLYASKTQNVILLDPEGATYDRLKNSALLSVRAPENVIMVSSKTPPAGLGVRHLSPVMNGDQFALEDLLRRLPAEDIHSIFVEGGAATFTSFVQQRAVDRIYFFAAPKLIGAGLSWYTGLEPADLGLGRMRTVNFGADVLITGRTNF